MIKEENRDRYDDAMKKSWDVFTNYLDYEVGRIKVNPDLPHGKQGYISLNRRYLGAADFSYSCFNTAHFEGANLRDVDLSEANVDGLVLDVNDRDKIRWEDDTVEDGSLLTTKQIINKYYKE